jgi:hypothetical protein
MNSGSTGGSEKRSTCSNSSARIQGVACWSGKRICVCVYIYIHTYIHTYIHREREREREREKERQCACEREETHICVSYERMML